MFGWIPTDSGEAGRYAGKYALCDATTGEILSGEIAGSFTAISNDEKCFMTSEKETISLWETETGKLIRTIQNDSIIPYKSNLTFDSDTPAIKATTPVVRMDSYFVSEEVLLDRETGKVTGRKDILPTETRFGNIVWKTDARHAVFWNLDDGRAIFTIRLLPLVDYRSSNIIGAIRFTSDGNALIYSTKMRPFRQRVMF
jgi:hypothetical protein